MWQVYILVPQLETTNYHHILYLAPWSIKANSWNKVSEAQNPHWSLFSRNFQLSCAKRIRCLWPELSLCFIFVSPNSDPLGIRDLLVSVISDINPINPASTAFPSWERKFTGRFWGLAPHLQSWLSSMVSPSQRALMDLYLECFNPRHFCLKALLLLPKTRLIAPDTFLFEVMWEIFSEKTLIDFRASPPDVWMFVFFPPLKKSAFKGQTFKKGERVI